MDTVHTLLKSAKHFFAGTALSRISGFFRDMAMALSFGAAPEIAAFMVAYRLANLLRRLFGEGNLQAGFIPHFESLRGSFPKAAFCFYRDSAYSIVILLSLVILGMEGILWCLLDCFSKEWRDIVELSMWMAPGLLFICLSALNSALLQCQKKYFFSAMAPIVFNVVWIAFTLLSTRFTIYEAVRFLSIGVTLGFVAQWGITTLQVRKELKAHLDWRERLQPEIFSPEWKKIIRPIGFGILGIGAMQINSALDAIFSRLADLSGPTYLWYAIRVQQLPLALFGIALSGALLPPLSRAIQEGDLEKYRFFLLKTLRQATALMVPCCFGFLALGASGLNLLYGRGHFSPADLQETLYCLWAYGAGLVPATFVLLLAAGCYAKKSYGSPAAFSLISVAVSVAMNAILVFGLHWGAISIALSTSLCAWLNLALLFPKNTLNSDFFLYFGKTTLASAVAASLTIFCGLWFGDGTFSILMAHSFSFSRELVSQMGLFFLMAGCFLISFLGMARLLKLDELFLLLRQRA